ncbi:Phosphoserine transaminase [Rhizina undulata]
MALASTVTTRVAMHSFSAVGPRIPEPIMGQSIHAMLNHGESGQGLLEYSPMSPKYQEVLRDVNETVRKLLGFELNDSTWTFPSWRREAAYNRGPQRPLEYAQRCLVGVKADYVYTGKQSAAAGMEAQTILGAERVNVAVDARDYYGTATYQSINRIIPNEADWNLTDNPDSLFTFYCDCEPSTGVEFKSLPECLKGRGLVVCDMGSNIFTKKIDNMNDYHVILAGMQHSIGPPGTTLVVVRTAILENQAPPALMFKLGLPAIPSSLSWHSLNRGYRNGNVLAPVMNIFTTNLILSKLVNLGGIDFAQQLITNRSDLIYRNLKRHSIYHMTAARNVRARTIICWKLGLQPPMDQSYHKEISRQFLQEAADQGLYSLHEDKEYGGI